MSLKSYYRATQAIKRAVSDKTPKEIKEAVEETTEGNSVLHELSEATNDFLVGKSKDEFERKSLNETRVILDETVVNATSNYTVSFYEAVICNGSFTVTFPLITTDDIYKPVTIINAGRFNITGKPVNSTIYGHDDVRIVPDSTLVFRVKSLTEWILS